MAQSGRKTSIYLSKKADASIMAAERAIGRSVPLSRLVSESSELYAKVVVALDAAPAVRVRMSPQGWVVDPIES